MEDIIHIGEDSLYSVPCRGYPQNHKYSFLLAYSAGFSEIQLIYSHFHTTMFPLMA